MHTRNGLAERQSVRGCEALSLVVRRLFVVRSPICWIPLPTSQHIAFIDGLTAVSVIALSRCRAASTNPATIRSFLHSTTRRRTRYTHHSLVSLLATLPVRTPPAHPVLPINSLHRNTSTAAVETDMDGQCKRRLLIAAPSLVQLPASARTAARSATRRYHTLHTHRCCTSLLRPPSVSLHSTFCPSLPCSTFLLADPSTVSPLPFSPPCGRRSLFGFSSTSPPIKQQIRRRLAFPPSAFYSLVLDVPSYQQFLPYCLHSSLVASTPTTHSFTAQLTLGFSQFNEHYTSLVTYSSPPTNTDTPTVQQQQQLYRVHARSLNSTIFRHLSSTWEIRTVAGRPRECDVLFDIEMSITNPLHRVVVSRVFANVAEQQLAAFVQRGQQLMAAAMHDRRAEREATNASQVERTVPPINRGVI